MVHVNCLCICMDGSIKPETDGLQVKIRGRLVHSNFGNCCMDLHVACLYISLYVFTNFLEH